MNSDTDRCEDPILAIRRTVSNVLHDHLVIVQADKIVNAVVDELPDFFRQPLRSDHEKDTQEEGTG
jgi:hypothetical protein